MGELFSVRSLIYWWGMLTASAFIKDWLASLSELLKDPETFNSEKIPFNMMPGLNAWIDGAADYVKNSVNFDPEQVIATIGPLAIRGWAVALVFGLIIIGFGIRLYIRALRSHQWFDDLFTLFILYIILRFEGHIVGSTGLPVQDWFKSLVENQFVSFFLIILLLLTLSFAGEGLRSKRAFWRALGAATLISLFIYPSQMASVLGYIVQALAFFGTSLSTQQNLPFTVAWGVIGMILAIHRLTTPEAAVGGKAEG
jgi:hypothetical protein